MSSIWGKCGIVRLSALILAIGIATTGAATAKPECDPLPFGASFCASQTSLEMIMRIPRDAGYIYTLPATASEIIEVSILAKPLADWDTTNPKALGDKLDIQYARQSGKDLADIPRLGKDSPMIAGQNAERSVYVAQGSNGDITIARSILVGKGFALYIYSETPGTNYSAAHMELHDQVLSHIRLTH